MRDLDTSERDVQELLTAGVIDGPAADRILAYIAERGTSRGDPDGSGGSALPSFDLVHAAYYLGGAVILFALAWFAAEAWDRYGGWPLAAVAAAYAAFFAIVGELLWQRGWRVPGGLLFTAAIAMTPLFVFAAQSGLGIWPGPGETWPRETYESVNGHRVTIEVVTLGAALLVVRLRPFAFHAVVLAAAAVALAWELGPLLVGLLSTEEAGQSAIIVAGGLLMGAAYLVDHRFREDYALWLYVAGLLSYWPLFTALHYDGIRYLVVNLLFIGLAVLIQRRVFLAVGAVGVFSYLMYLANEVFRDSLLYPAALSGIGLLFILAGVAYAKRQARARAWLLDRMPASWVDSLPQNRSAASAT